jgi:hypothetical protein
MPLRLGIVMRIITVLLLLASSYTWAEISSLTSEELTDTYIRDTTVIVRQPEQEAPDTKIPVKLKVTPLEQAAQILPPDQTHSVSSISNELNTYDDLNNFRALDNDLQASLPPATTQFLQDGPSLEVLQKIQVAYGLDDLPTNLASLNFLPSLTIANPADAALQQITGIDTTDNSFTFSIPNTGNFNSQQIQSPNGEIAVNVTPATIQYTINLPK